MRPDIVMAVDPGKMTGWAVWVPGEDDIKSGQSPWLDFLSRYESWISAVTFPTTVVERFTVGKETLKKTRQYHALEAIGVLRYLSITRTSRDIILQTPAAAKSFSTSDKLKKLGWWPVGQDHAQDACRHMLVYAAEHSAELDFDLTQIM